MEWANIAPTEEKKEAFHSNKQGKHTMPNSKHLNPVRAQDDVSESKKTSEWYMAWDERVG